MLTSDLREKIKAKAAESASAVDPKSNDPLPRLLKKIRGAAELVEAARLLGLRRLPDRRIWLDGDYPWQCRWNRVLIPRRASLMLYVGASFFKDEEPNAYLISKPYGPRLWGFSDGGSGRFKRESPSEIAEIIATDMDRWRIAGMERSARSFERFDNMPRLLPTDFSE